MERTEKIMKRLEEHYKCLEKQGYEIVALMLQGSQNYGLDIYDDDYQSDIDTKAIILPSFEDIVYNRKPISETLILENNEHIDVKDIRVMFKAYEKQNINYIETLFTEFKIINPKYQKTLQPIFDNNEDIAHIDFNQALNCMVGMSLEKYKALEHPYPNTKDKIAKFGYDPKQLHHILRLNDFIIKYSLGMPYEKCLIPKDPEDLIEVKKGKFSLEHARQIANMTIDHTKSIKNTFMLPQDKINEKAIKILDKVKYDILKQKFKEDILK